MNFIFMNRHVLFLFFLGTLPPVMGICQYTGGNNDGSTYLPIAKTNITDAIAFRGSTHDGFSHTLLNRTNINDVAAFRGGGNDGFQSVFLGRNNIIDIAAFRGGGDDGFQSVFLGRTNITDGIAFKGGSGRGEIQGRLGSCVGEIVVWNGSQNSDWNNEANWNCGRLPNITSTVIISSGVLYYPKVSFNFEINKLILNNNAIITIQPGIKFKIIGQ